MARLFSSGDVVLPAWASSPEDFVRQHRMALESDHVSRNLHLWIDLIFGAKQRGKPAVDAHNLFFHLTYEGSKHRVFVSHSLNVLVFSPGAVNMETITDPIIRAAYLDQIEHFGQTPTQIFFEAHPARDGSMGEFRKLYFRTFFA